MYQVTSAPGDQDTDTDAAFLAAFEAGRIAPSAFDHRAHLRAAACALARYPFLEACVAMRDGLGRIARAAGVPQRYHETQTVALMTIVADRIEATGAADAAAVIAASPELFDRSLIDRYYGPATLASPAARRRLVLEMR